VQLSDKRNNGQLVPNDGSKRSSVFAQVQDADLSEVHTVALRGGFRLSGAITPWMHWPLGDAGTTGDVTASDRTFSTNALGLPTDAKGQGGSG
jgi:hypothetical protein